MLKTVRSHYRRRKHLRAACILLVVLLGFNLAAEAVPLNACGGDICCGHCGPTDNGPATLKLKATAPGGCCHGSGNSSCAADTDRSANRTDQPAAIGYSTPSDPTSPWVPAVNSIPGIRAALSEFRPQTTSPGTIPSPPLYLALGMLRR